MENVIQYSIIGIFIAVIAALIIKMIDDHIKQEAAYPIDNDDRQDGSRKNKYVYFYIICFTVLTIISYRLVPVISGLFSSKQHMGQIESEFQKKTDNCPNEPCLDQPDRVRHLGNPYK